MSTYPASSSLNTCTTCGKVSPLLGYFSHHQNQQLCKECHLERSDQTIAQLYTLWGGATILSALLALIFLFLNHPLQFVFGQLALLLPIWMITLLIYGVIYLVVAQLVNLQLYELHFGDGKVLLKSFFGETRIILRLYPTFLSEQIGWEGNDYLKWRLLAYYMAPIISFGTFLWMSYNNINIQQWGLEYQFLDLFFVTSIFMLYTIGISESVSLRGTKIKTSQSMIKMIWNNKYRFDTQEIKYQAHLYAAQLKDENLEKASDTLKVISNKYPGDLSLAFFQATHLVYLEKQDEAFYAYQNLLDRFSDPTMMRQRVLYEMARLGFFLPIPLEEIIPYAREAYQLTPWNPLSEGILGLILVASGALDEGIELLEQVEKKSLPGMQRAFVLAYLAVGYFQRSKIEQSKKFLQEALKLGKDDETIHAIRRIIEQQNPLRLSE